MIRVKISSSNPEFPLIRQTPDAKGIWDKFIFYINQDIEECDYWVILDSLTKTETTSCRKENVILITGEPESVKKYSRFFINQFSKIITCHRYLKHDNVTIFQQGLPWMAGAKYLIKEKKWDSDCFISYNDFSGTVTTIKNKEISIIVSNKTFTPGHEQRIIFLTRLKEALGDRMEIFGRGFNEIDDKYFGLIDFKYAIVLENSTINDYWTEKLSDAFLCGCYPVYYGCPNIHDYFPKGSLAIIDIYDIEGSIKTITGILASDEYEKSIELVKKSKELILNKYNVFPLIVNYISALKEDKITTKAKSVKIYPEKRFRKKIRNFINRITSLK